MYTIRCKCGVYEPTFKTSEEAKAYAEYELKFMVDLARREGNVEEIKSKHQYEIVKVYE